MIGHRVISCCTALACLFSGCDADPTLPDGRRLSDVLLRLRAERATERSAALAELGRLGPTATAAVDEVTATLRDDDNPRVRAAAADCLADIGSAPARDALLAVLEAPAEPADVAARVGAALRIAPDEAIASVRRRAVTDPVGTAAALAAPGAWTGLDPGSRRALLEPLTGYRGTDRRTLLTVVRRTAEQDGSIDGMPEFITHAAAHGVPAEQLAAALAAQGDPAAWQTFRELAHAADPDRRVAWVSAAPGFIAADPALEPELVVGFVIAHSTDIAPRPLRRAACAALVDMATRLDGPARDATVRTLAERLGEGGTGIAADVALLLARTLPDPLPAPQAWVPALLAAAQAAQTDDAALRILTAARSLFAGRAPDALLEGLDLALPSDTPAPPSWLDPAWQATEDAHNARPELRQRLQRRLLADTRLPHGARRAAGAARALAELAAGTRRQRVREATVGNHPCAWPVPFVEQLDPSADADLDLLVEILQQSADADAARVAARRILERAPASARIVVRLDGSAPLETRLLTDRTLRALAPEEQDPRFAMLYLAPAATPLADARFAAGRTVAWLDAEGRVLALRAPDATSATPPDAARAALALPPGRPPGPSLATGRSPLPGLPDWLPLAR